MKKITRGAVNAEVALERQRGQELVAIITQSSLDELGLDFGRAMSSTLES